MDFLSKKGIVDQTEKLALARISGKMKISSEEAEMSIIRLCAKNLVRKVYLQGRVGFELTPRGKSTIEVLARAETERITRQLQESIHQERKTKLRLGAVTRMQSIADEWQNIQVPDRKLIGEVELEATRFLATTKEIEAKQPFCHIDTQSYEQEFSKYKPQIEKLIEQNSDLSRAISNYSKIKTYIRSLSADIESIDKAIRKYESIAEAAVQVSELKVSFCGLELIQSQLESFDRDQLSRFEELKIKLADNFRLLETLKKPTHEFAPIKREILAENTALSPDPELPMKYGGKTSGIPLLEKCSKCGTKRKSTPVNIG